MRLTITSHAQKQIGKLPKITQIILARKINKLTSGLSSDCDKLKGYKNFFRTRVGNYRIVFVKYTEEIEVVSVGHRREIYKLVRKLF